MRVPPNNYGPLFPRMVKFGVLTSYVLRNHAARRVPYWRFGLSLHLLMRSFVTCSRVPLDTSVCFVPWRTPHILHIPPTHPAQNSSICTRARFTQCRSLGGFTSVIMTVMGRSLQMMLGSLPLLFSPVFTRSGLRLFHCMKMRGFPRVVASWLLNTSKATLSWYHPNHVITKQVSLRRS